MCGRVDRSGRREPNFLAVKSGKKCDGAACRHRYDTLIEERHPRAFLLAGAYAGNLCQESCGRFARIDARLAELDRKSRRGTESVPASPHRAPVVRARRDARDVSRSGGDTLPAP